MKSVKPKKSYVFVRKAETWHNVLGVDSFHERAGELQTGVLFPFEELFEVERVKLAKENKL